MLIFKETSHKREAKGVLGGRVPGLGLGMNSPIALSRRMKKKKSGSEA